jgi:hypothetical protein
MNRLPAFGVTGIKVGAHEDTHRHTAAISGTSPLPHTAAPSGLRALDCYSAPL